MEKRRWNKQNRTDLKRVASDFMPDEKSVDVITLLLPKANREFRKQMQKEALYYERLESKKRNLESKKTKLVELYLEGLIQKNIYLDKKKEIEEAERDLGGRRKI